MEEPLRPQNESATRIPRAGARLMIIIVAGLALVAVYANVQRIREDKIERVIITPASTATPTAMSPRR